MTRRVIDSSVILTILFGEQGKERAAELARGGILSSVSLAEIIAKCLKRSVPKELAVDFVRYTNMTIAGFDEDLALSTDTIWRKAPDGVLSLGDRACIATAIRMEATAVTADRIWADLNLSCPVELIR
jgi:PIN domain nuclease of toxin-antitoxin system